MLHISQVFYKKEQSDAAKEGRPIKDFGEFAKHLNQHIYNNSIFTGKVHDNIVKILLKTQLVVEQKYAIIGGGDGAKDSKGVISKNDQGRKEQQLQAKENEYHRNILQIAKQNMHDSAAKKFARDEALMQQAYAIGGEIVPLTVAPIEGRKTTADTDRNISEYFDNPNNKYSNNELVKSAA
ncbi:hypothetical protein [Candidatus Tisiphia endosymbiont of Oplodontha viridula]|uniref:hypothetical protein n=1 Tax=Candidatus Tisiphia endosymbiont of Oplodontha viridula TaxID=3077925 RepID=UPI0035C8DB79